MVKGLASKQFSLKLSYIENDKEYIIEQEYNHTFKELKTEFWHWSIHKLFELYTKYSEYRSKELYLYVEKKEDYGEKHIKEVYQMIIVKNGVIQTIFDDDIANNVNRGRTE